MRLRTGNSVSLIGLASVILALTVLPLHAQSWEEGFPVRITYQELEGEGYGCADVTLFATIPVGTPLIARERAVENALDVLHSIWNIESIHEDVRGLLGPVVPMDVQYSVSEIAGTDFIVALVDAFEMVEDAGFSRFQVNTPISATERVSIPRGASVALYPDPPRFFAWIIGEGWSEDVSGREKWVIASLVNCSAAVLSFRSEYGRFPNSFAELRETGHLLIEPLNPYTGEPVREVSGVSPGDISYEYVSSQSVVLLTYVQVGSRVDVVRREISVSSSGAYDLLYRQTAGLSESDRTVARYVFQISQILNEYYSEYRDLPYRVPQCEAEAFAYVSFMNPYTHEDAHQADSLADIEPGDYTFHRVSSTSYFLVGYGGSGEAIISVSKDFRVQ